MPSKSKECFFITGDSDLCHGGTGRFAKFEYLLFLLTREQSAIWIYCQMAIPITMVNTGKWIDDENGALSKKCELNDVQPKRWRGGESEETTASALILGLWQVRLKLCNHLPFFFIICIMVMIL